MSTGSRWLTAMVTGGAVIGASAALASASPSSSPSSAPIAAATVPADPSTLQTRSVVDQARQLAAEIATIQGELSQLERQVPIAPTTPVPSSSTTTVTPLAPTTTTAPVTHTTTGASSATTSDDGGGD